MISEHDLQEAIAECEGVRNPNANTCIKLASYYTILNHMNRVAPVSYSYSPAPDDYESDTEFMKLVRDKNEQDVWRLLDELVSTVEVLNPNLYKSFIRHLTDLKG